MIDLDSSFSAAIAAGTIQLTELYEVTLANGDTYYYANHIKDITWNSQLYTALPVQRTPLNRSTSGEPDSIEIMLANISGDLVDVVQKNLLDNAIVTIKRICRDLSYATDKEITVFKGVADVEFNRDYMKLICSDFLNSLNIQCPRNMFQEPCNRLLFDDHCSVDISNYSHVGIATSTAGTNYYLVDADLSTVCSALDSDASYLNVGELRIDEGSNAGQRRMIRRVTMPDTIYIASAFPYPVESGSSYTIYAGCDKKPETCHNIFSNDSNFNGFMYIPKPEDQLMP